MSWFVTGRKHRKLQAANTALWREVRDAARELAKLELGSTVEDWARDSYSLAHRIRIHEAALKYQPMADAEGKTYTWVCAPGVAVAWEEQLPLREHGQASFHQHSVTPRVREEKV